jgi:hypothetical protein
VDKARLTFFGEKWIALFAWPGTPLYLHILVSHYNELQGRFGDLSKYSQQSTENYHGRQKAALLHATNRNGGKGNRNAWQQVLLYDFRSKTLAQRLKRAGQLK